MHVNQRVREAARERVEGTDLFAHVFTHRTANLVDAQLPAVVITTSTDEVAVQTKDDPPSERRRIELMITIVADGESETLDDDLDDLRAAIEDVMQGDLGGSAWCSEHTGGALELAEAGDRWFAFYALSWEVTVWTEQGSP